MIRDSKTRVARGMLVAGLAVTLLLAGASAAFATVRTEAATKTKTTKVTVVVGDVEVPGMEHGHPPGSMTMTVTPPSAPHGKVKFILKNEGTEPHEMVVIKTKTPFDQMPVNAKNKVSESGSMGEIHAIGKGKSKSNTLKLKRGSYVLVCNITEHYGAGMRAPFTVT